MKKNLTPAAEQTCENFLRAAEEIYINHGYSGSSIRAISDRAGANLGTMHHYWGSKSKLFEDLFVKRFTPLREQHLAQFTQLLHEYKATGQVDIAQVVRILLNPPEEIAGSRENTLQWSRLYARVLADPAPEVISVMNNIFAEPVKLLFNLLRSIHPTLSDGEFRTRILFLITTVTYRGIFSTTKSITKFLGNDDSSDADRLEWMTHFLVAGFSSPPTATLQTK